MKREISSPLLGDMYEMLEAFNTLFGNDGTQLARDAVIVILDQLVIELSEDLPSTDLYTTYIMCIPPNFRTFVSEADAIVLAKMFIGVKLELTNMLLDELTFGTVYLISFDYGGIVVEHTFVSREEGAIKCLPRP